MPTVASLTARISLDDQPLQRGLSAAEGKIKSFAQQMNSVGTKLSLGVTAPLVLLGRQAVTVAASFEQSQNIFQAVTRATSGQMAQMSKLARELGADMTLPATSAVDAAQAMTQLGKAGLSVENTMGAARGTLQLAAAAGVEAGQAADIAAGALNSFRLSGDQASRVADLLAGASVAAQGEITDMAIALQQASAAAALNGQSIDDTVTAIAALASAGIRGSDAGTSLRVMLGRLQPQTKEAAAMIKHLGLQATDARGQFLPLRDVIAKYSAALKNATPAQRQNILRTIFGEDAQRAAGILLLNAEAFDKVGEAVTRQGQAATIAGAKNKGLAGALDAMRSAFETAAESAITPFIQDLASLARGAGETMAAFSRLPEPIRKAVVVVASLAALAGPTILFLGQFKGAAAALGLSMPAVATAIRGVIALLTGPWGLAIAAAITAIGLLKTAWDKDLGGMRTTITEWFAQVGPLMEMGWQGIVEGAQAWWSGLKESWTLLWQSMAESTGGFINQIVQWLMKLPAALGLPVEQLQQYLAWGKVGMAMMPAAEGGPAAPRQATAGAASGLGIGLPKTEETERDRQLKALAAEEKLLQRLADSYRLKLSPAMRESIGQYSELYQTELKRRTDLKQFIDEQQTELDLMEQFSAEVRGLELKLAEAKGRGGMGLLDASKRYEKIGGKVNLKQIAELNTAIAQTTQKNEDALKIESARKQMNEQLLSQSVQYTAEMHRLTGITNVYKFSLTELGIQFATLNKEQQEQVEGLYKTWKENLQVEQWLEMFRQVRNGMESIFTDAFTNLSQGFGGFFSNIYQGFKQMLVRMAAEYLSSRLASVFTQLLGNFLGPAFGGILGKPGTPDLSMGGAAYSGGLSGAIKSSFGNMKIMGSGGSFRSGQPMLVGDRGPEVIMPRRGGHVVPNHQLAGAGGGPVNITFNISAVDADSFRRNQQALMTDALAQAQRAQRRNG